jgi:hypothetical protein
MNVTNYNNIFRPRIVFVLFSTMCAAIFMPARAAGAETVCAEVVIRLSQRVTFERQAFEASLTITNGTDIPLTDLAVVINFKNSKGDTVAHATPDESPGGALFYVRPRTDSWNPAGNANVMGNEKKEAAWLMVPSPGAAGEGAGGEIYAVGATITYTYGGQAQTLQVVPDNILVSPMPALVFQYFLPGDVPGIDPMLSGADINSADPFDFALRVVNNSPFATAGKVRVESNQPEIIANESNLPLQISIIGAQVNGQAATAGLLADFGDITPASSASAIWTLTSNIAGRFADVRGEITHAVALGGSLTSLIEADVPMARRLLGMVTVDLPGRDNLPDILAAPTFEATLDSVTIHESDNSLISQPVTYVSTDDARLLFSEDGSRLSVNGCEAELLYIRVPGKIAELRPVTVLRSDGKLLPSGNAWISRSYRPGGGWDYWLNVFDTSKGANDAYSFSYGAGGADARLPSITFEPSGPAYNIRTGQVFNLAVTAKDGADNPLVAAAGDLPAGASFSSSTPQVLYWKPAAGQQGLYNVRFSAKNGRLSAARTAVLNVISGDVQIKSWSDWWRLYWPDGAAPAYQSDPGRKGLSVLLQYALDMDPTTGDLDGQPAPSVVERDGFRYLALTYRLRVGDASLDVRPQVSAEMFGWRDLVAEPEAVGEPYYGRTGDVREWRVVDTIPLPENGQGRYIRLSVRLKSDE